MEVNKSNLSPPPRIVVVTSDNTMTVNFRTYQAGDDRGRVSGPLGENGRMGNCPFRWPTCLDGPFPGTPGGEKEK